MRRAWLIVILFGLVSLLADVSYEGMRAILAQFLAKKFGVGLAIVGLIAGLGELVAFALRYPSGVLADRTRAYWVFVFLGYALVGVAVLLLSVAWSWLVVLALVLLERFGKAVRAPARDSILSVTAERVKVGRAFAVHEVLDQAGAMLGPLIAFLMLSLGFRFSHVFMLLAFGGFASVCVLAVIYAQKPPQPRGERAAAGVRIPRLFTVYALFILFAVAAAVSPLLILGEVEKGQIVPTELSPLIYFLTMAVDAIAAAALGSLYDRVGLLTLLSIPLASVVSALGYAMASIEGVLLSAVALGVVLGGLESIGRSAVVTLVPAEARATAYGIFYTMVGAGMLAGVLYGLLYDIGMLYLAPVISVLLAIASLCLLSVLLRSVPRGA